MLSKDVSRGGTHHGSYTNGSILDMEDMSINVVQRGPFILVIYDRRLVLLLSVWTERTSREVTDTESLTSHTRCNDI
jgi:hypothetical protein